MNNIQSISSNEDLKDEDSNESSEKSERQLILLASPPPLSQSHQSHHSVAKSETNNLEIRKLTWDDFQGVPDDDDPALAHTLWKIGYNYQMFHIEDKIQVTVDVWCKVDPTSWVKVKFHELLNHQQGYFYIGMICALEFKKKVQEFLFTKNYKLEISDIFNRTLLDHLELERQYDMETLNMLNTAKQRQWDIKIMKMLTELSEFQ